jgi:hypothetical protein
MGMRVFAGHEGEDRSLGRPANRDDEGRYSRLRAVGVWVVGSRAEWGFWHRKMAGGRHDAGTVAPGSATREF